MRPFAAVALVFLVAATVTTGCAVGLMVPGPPPAPIVEVRAGMPGPAYVWLGGYWSWRSRWIWVPGSWAVPPHARAVWVTGRWTQRGGGWRWTPGYWRRR